MQLHEIAFAAIAVSFLLCIIAAAIEHSEKRDIEREWILKDLEKEIKKGEKNERQKLRSR